MNYQISAIMLKTVWQQWFFIDKITAYVVKIKLSTNRNY